jgi:MFS family permease
MHQPKGSLFTAAFIALTLSDLAYFMGAGALIGVTPFFVTGPLGSGEAGVGFAVGAFSVTTLLLRPLAGRWTDRHGRRPLLIAGALLFAVLVLGHLVVTDLIWLVVLRLLLGVAEALYFVAGFAALADLAPVGRAGEALSFNSLALYVGVAAGSLIGQVLLGWAGFNLVWVCVALFAGIAAVLAARVPETLVRSDAAPAPSPLIHRAALLPGLGLFAGVVAMSGFFAFAALHATDVGFKAWSVVLLVFGTVVVSCRILFATLPDRFPPMRLAAAALAACTLGLTITATVPAAWSLLVGSGVLAVGVAFLTPSVFAVIFSLVSASERGSAAGTASVFIDLGLGGGPMLLGLVAASSGIPAAFLVAAVLTALGGALLLSRPIPPARRPMDRSV